MRKLNAVFVFCFFSIDLIAQSLSPKVLPVSGGYYVKGGYSLSWSVGQIATQTISNSNFKLSQGFQQPEVDIRLNYFAAFVCADAYYLIPFTANGIVNINNSFTVQLSDADGSFVNAEILANVTGNSSGFIAVLIPEIITPGFGYKLKIVASSPYRESNIMDIEVKGTPAPPLINSDSPLCEGSTLHLIASTISGAAYEWNGPSGVFSALQNPEINNVTIADDGDYFATATLNGCKSNSSNIINVEINPTPPAPVASANSTLLCEGNTLNLYSTGEPGAIFSWSGPNAFSSSDQNPVFPSAHEYESGNYSLQQYVGVCASPYSNVINVLISPYPSTPVTSSNSPVCQGDTLQLNAELITGAVYFWSGPDFFSSNQQNPLIENTGFNAAGNYMVTVSVNGCTSPEQNDVVIGSGNGSNTNVTYPAPYGTWNYGARHQMLYRSTELIAAGLSAGSIITQAGFDVLTAEPGAVYQLFTMSLKNTTASDLASGFEVMPVTSFNGGTQTPSAGWNLLTLDHPFTWDGTSNILVEVCNDADGNAGGAFNYNSITRMTTGLPANTTRWRAQNQPCGDVPNESYGGVTTERPDIRFVASGQFENVIVLPSPYISLFSPEFGGIGSSVIIDGGGFTGATNVNFNLTAATYSVNSDNQISTTVPAGTTDGLIEVIAANGCSAVSSTNFLVTVSGFAMHLKVFIQGMYAGAGFMTSPLNNSGISSVTNECDSITVELHDASNTSFVVDSKTVVLHTDGNADIQFTNVPDGSYCYIVIKHRNSIETWSKDPYIFSSNSLFQYDFSQY